MSQRRRGLRYGGWRPVALPYLPRFARRPGVGSWRLSLTRWSCARHVCGSHRFFFLLGQMARSLNKASLIGNVGGDPDVRTTPSGTRVAKVSLATSRSFSDRSGQQQDRTQWHRLTFFGRLTDIVEQWVKKGDKLFVEGRIEYSQSQDEHGNQRYWTDIIVNEMIMLGSGRGDGEAERGRSDYTPPARKAPITEPEDDLPF